MNLLYDNLTVGDNGGLEIGGVDTAYLANKYKTPLYVIDEDRIRENMRRFKTALEKNFPAGSKVLFASKALSYVDIYRIAKSEGVGTDAVSSGEIYTALKAGLDPKDICFHGNNKTDEDIEYALSVGVGLFAVDNFEELYALNTAAKKAGKVQKILLRITPGVDPHTHKKIMTGSVDSKFGTAIQTGQAFEIVKAALECENVKLVGYHCHIGSQIFESDSFEAAADIMIKFIADVKEKFGAETEYLNIGGGFGVPYTSKEKPVDIDALFANIRESICKTCEKYNVPFPKILTEPGRGIVADAGITLYTVGSRKEITGVKTYLSVDGGMPDNPRYTLYRSEYTILCANRMNEKPVETVSIAGRCCESGDLIQEDVPMCKCKRGDLLAVLSTGAYNYSMASNYNKLPRPALVSVGHGKDRIVIKRESFEDLIKNEL